MQVTQAVIPCKAKNFICRLRKLSTPVLIEIKAVANKLPELKAKKKPPEISKLSKSELEDLQYLNLQKRITKQLLAKGMDITEVMPIKPIPKPKRGIMDGIGKIIETSFTYSNNPIVYNN